MNKLTNDEVDAIEFVLNRLHFPLDSTQLNIVAKTLGPSCVVPEHYVKTILKNLLKKNKQTREDK
jgi:hypothetical protein